MYLIERKPTLSDFFGIAVKTTSRQASSLSVSQPPKRTKNGRYSHRWRFLKGQRPVDVDEHQLEHCADLAVHDQPR